MALVAANSSIPFDSTHAYVYKEAALRMPPQDFAAVSQRQPQLMEHAETFRTILKYFEIKPGYLLVVRLFHFLGFNLVIATYLPSIVSYFFIGCLLLLWMQRIFSMPFAMITTLLIAASPFLVQTARYSSPDMLCAAILLVSIYLISESSFSVLGLLVCGLAIPVRRKRRRGEGARAAGPRRGDALHPGWPSSARKGRLSLLGRESRPPRAVPGPAGLLHSVTA